MRLIYSLAFLIVLNISCKSQTSPKSDKAFEFFDITFYSSECNGTCPDITMNINSDKTTQLIRQVFKSKGVADTSKSGGFKGKLSQKDFDKLILLIKEIDWDHIDWPKVSCCDLPIKTVMVGINGFTKNFKSMKWPEEANKLIEFLTELGTNVKLPEYTGPMDFEVMTD